MPDQKAQAIRQIPIENLQLDMVVAKDVVTPDGRVLLARNTMLNDIHLRTFTQNFVGTISIKESSIRRGSDYLNWRDHPEKKNAIPRLPEFETFRHEYVEKSDELKNAILTISDGGEIEMESLYTLTDGVMNQLRYKSDIFVYLNNLRDTDEPTFTHSTNVSLLTNLFGRWIGLEESEMVKLTVAASLHDLGKTKVPHEILTKPGALTDEEFAIMKKHTVFGYRMLEEHNIPNEVKIPALTHHEKIDGSGYPMGLKGEKITMFSKIITICDIYDAMTANRAYRGKVCPFTVIKNFEQSSYGQIDTAYLFVFLQNIAHTYLSNYVILSDGRTAEVVFIHQNNLSKPIVRVGEELIDLAETPNLIIEQLL